MDESGHLARYGEIQRIAMNAQYLLIERRGHAQVRYIPASLTPQLIWPLAWSSATVQQEQRRWFTVGASLLSPHFVAAMISPNAVDDSAQNLKIRIHRLERTSSRLMATILMTPQPGGPVCHIASGVDILPNEKGLVVISALGGVVSLPSTLHRPIKIS